MSDLLHPPIDTCSIRELAEVVPAGGIAGLTGPRIGVTSEAEELRKERLAAFPIDAPEPWRTTLAEHVERFARYRVPRIHLMSIPGCELAGPHLVALKDGRAIRETVRGGASFRDRSVFARLDDGRHALRPDLARTSIDGEALVLGAKAMRGYFHWMTEVVPRLVAARQDEAVRRLPVVMRPTPQRHERETLDWLGVEPVTVETPLVDVERAVLPSYPIDGRRGGRYSAELVELARTFRRDHVPDVDGPTPRRLYVSRRDAARRHVADEDRLESCLRDLGFECVTLAGRSVAEQVRLFEHAEVVVAQHGAGLTNLLFCRPRTRVVELYPDGFLAPSPFWTIAALADLRYEMVVCAVEPSSFPEGGVTKDADLVVDLPSLERRLRPARRRRLLRR